VKNLASPCFDIEAVPLLANSELRSAGANKTEERGMANKGYWIGHVDITDPERYKDYIAANAVAFGKYGARFLVRNGACEVPEGNLKGRRHVVIEFDSYAAAKACYDSPEYQAAIAIRSEASIADLVIIEGYEG
jgi:uncharacterized protein (DUF1330 family)